MSETLSRERLEEALAECAVDNSAASDDLGAHIAELEAENERLRAVVEAAEDGCNTCHKYNGEDHCCDCYHAGSGTWDALCAWKEGE